MSRRRAGADPGPALFAAIRRAVERDRLMAPGDTVLVACSGGPDSMALLHLLHEGAAGVPVRLVAAHFDHRLRSSSRLDADLVRATAKALGIRFVGGAGNVAARARRTGGNLEETAREMRYDFLRAAAEKVGAARIAVAHTLDDQAETVLLRLMRGTGLTGLTGMAPATTDGIVRPLLGVRRRELLAYLRGRRIAFREDESNRDTRRLRNRVRVELVPLLERRYESAIALRLARLADLVRGDEQVLAEAGRKAFERISRAEGGRVRLDARRLARLPEGLARRAVRELLRRLKGDLRAIGADDVERVRGLREGEETTLPGDIVVKRRDGWIGLRGGAGRRRPLASRSWDGKEPLDLPEAGVRLTARRMRRAGRGKPPAFDDSRRALLDAARIAFPLEVRGARPGDRYRPLGAPGRKRVTDILRERGVPAAERPARPVVLSAGEIVWVAGAPVAEAFRIAPSTRHILLLEIMRSG